MKSNKQTGFTVVEGLLVVMIVGLLGFTSYYVWHTQQAVKKPVATTPVEAAPKAAQPAGQASTQTMATNYLTIKEWGVRIPNGTTDTFLYHLKGNYAQLSTTKLAAADPACSADKGPAVGVIQRATANEPVYEDGTTAIQAYKSKTWAVGHVGSYYYVYTAPDASCSANQSATEIQHTAITEIRALVALTEAANSL